MVKKQKSSIPKLRDIYEKPKIDLKGERISADSILGEEVTFLEYRKLASKYPNMKDPTKPGEYALVQIERSGKQYVFSTGSMPVMDQLDQMRELFPFKATLTKPKNYYKLA